ncbi:MAG: hypothetical protein EAZ89_18440 [Bacteroidetes bacterium]|nr:MAG: hypothetical protein EAZ89_18440 [Bacteroidota bacterium]
MLAVTPYRSGISLLGLLLLLGTLSAQPCLSVEKSGGRSYLRFHIGDAIRILDQQGNIRYGRIESLGDSSILLSCADASWEDRVYLRDIYLIYDQRPTAWRRLRHGYSTAVNLTGGILVCSSVMGALLLDDPPQPADISLTGMLLISGAAVKALGRDKYRIGRRWRVYTRPDSL